MKQIFISILLAGSLAAGTIIAQNTAKTKQIFKNGAVEFSISVAEIDSVIFTQVETNNAIMHIMRNDIAVFQSAAADIDSIVYYLPNIPVTSISLNHATFSLFAGETYTLTTTVLPENATNRTVTWTSSDTNIAIVDANGKVTAIIEGTAIITAQAGEKTATCEVRVKNVPADGVLINGIVWATRNVDMPGTFAENPEDAGMFYQWNRPVGWSSTNPLVSSNGSSWNSTTPAGTQWVITNDPCPGGWRVPTWAELTILRNQPSVWTTKNGVNGRLFGTAPNQIFLPAADWRSNLGTLVHIVGTTGNYTFGNYWSSTQHSVVSSIAESLQFDSTSTSGWKSPNRAFGYNVRCVMSDIIINATSVRLNYTSFSLFAGDTHTLTATVLPHNAMNRNVTWRSSDTDIATVDANGRVTTISAGIVTITVQTEDGQFEANCEITVYDEQHRYNDIGVVIAGRIWATRNVGAPGTFAVTPESSGMFYQWNRNIGWSSVNPLVDSNGGTAWDNSAPEGTEWYAENDPCPSGWRVPTREELISLRDAGSIWVTQNGVNGRVFGTAPNQIFLPAAGSRLSSTGARDGATGTGYWSNTTRESDMNAVYLHFSSGLVMPPMRWHNRAHGFPVRCIVE